MCRELAPPNRREVGGRGWLVVSVVANLNYVVSQYMSTDAFAASASRSARHTHFAQPGRRPMSRWGKRFRCRGDGAVDEGDVDGSGDREGVGVEDSVAGRSAIQEQRQLFAKLFGVGGAGLTRGFGEPRGKGLLVVAGGYACRVARGGVFAGR